MIIDVDSALRVKLLYVLLKALECKLITIFEVTIVVSVLLHCIVRQVHEGVVDVLEVDSKL